MISLLLLYGLGNDSIDIREEGVIPAKAGIQIEKTGFRIRFGMTLFASHSSSVRPCGGACRL